MAVEPIQQGPIDGSTFVEQEIHHTADGMIASSLPLNPSIILQPSATKIINQTLELLAQELNPEVDEPVQQPALEASSGALPGTSAVPSPYRETQLKEVLTILFLHVYDLLFSADF